MLKRLGTRPYSSVERIKRATHVRGASLEAALATGVVEYDPRRETLMFFDRIYQVQSTRLRQHLPQHRYKPEELREKMLRYIGGPGATGASIVDTVPLPRDGGVFVKLRAPEGTEPQSLAAAVASNVTSLKDGHYGGILWAFSPWPMAHEVIGTPWVEDLSRFPSPVLKVLFEGKPLTEEEMYVIFRRYGMLVDIVPSGNGATVQFALVRLAVFAKNCVTGLVLPECTVHLQYVPRERRNQIISFVVSHQRIAIPLILALLAGAAVLVFDPIRQYFIEAKVTRRLELESYKRFAVVRWITAPYHWFSAGYKMLDETLCSEELRVARHRLERTQNDHGLFMEREDKAAQFLLWLHENVGTFVVVRGPRGLGKADFVLLALKADGQLGKNVLRVDCDAITKAALLSQLIKLAAQQVGYFPVFTWANGVLQFIDLGVQGLTGQKSGLSELKETQLKNMFLLTGQALRKVALRDYRLYKKEVAAKSSENHQSERATEDTYLLQHPEVKPVVVIEKFLRAGDGSNDFAYQMLAEWAAQLIHSNVAHVVFVTPDVGLLQHLRDALPNLVFKSVALADALPTLARDYVRGHLPPGASDQADLDMCLEPLGGRMLDLQAYVRRISLGELPEHAVEEMVSQAAEQIATFFLNSESAEWSTAQIWAVVRLLARRDTILFEDLMKLPLFSKSLLAYATLSTLEKHELVTLHKEKGILKAISVGRPLFKAAFANLLEDPRAFFLYETEYYSRLVSLENDKIAKLEDELARVSSIKDAKLLSGRMLFVAGKIKDATAKIQGYEEQMKQLAKGH